MESKSSSSIPDASRLPNWTAVRERLDREREATLPKTDTSQAIRQFRLAWEAAKTNGWEERQTGLVEQQACFSALKKANGSDASHG